MVDNRRKHLAVVVHVILVVVKGKEANNDDG